MSLTLYQRSTRDSQLGEDKDQVEEGDDQELVDVIAELVNIIAKNRKTMEKKTGITSLLRIYNQGVLRKLQSKIK